MGSSAKKKARKAASFQKTKLRVGKPSTTSNTTSTTFRSKPLILAAQSLNLTAPSTTTQTTHHLSLLSHHSSSTRRDSLNHLTTHLPPPSAIPRLLPLTADPSRSVRAALRTLLEKFSPADIAPFAPAVRLYLWAAMSHLEPDVRGDATRFVAWGLDVLGREIVADGGWRRGLEGWVGVVEMGVGGEGLAVLMRFLKVGGDEDEVVVRRRGLWGGGERYSGRVGVRGYRGLGLFAAGEDGGEDAEGRRRWVLGEGSEVVGRLRVALGRGLKGGGEVGRMAVKVLAVLDALGTAVG